MEKDEEWAPATMKVRSINITSFSKQAEKLRENYVIKVQVKDMTVETQIAGAPLVASRKELHFPRDLYANGSFSI